MVASMELLPAIVGLAVIDSVNPSALLATIVLLLRGRQARPLVAVYLIAVLAIYFVVGVGFDPGAGAHAPGSDRERRRLPGAGRARGGHADLRRGCTQP